MVYGSTAYRKATEASLAALFTAGTFTSVQYDNGSSTIVTATSLTSPLPSALLSTTNVIWKGTMTAFGSQPITVYCNWAGSVGGIKSLASLDHDRDITFYLKDGGSYGQYSSATNEVAMSDCDQTSTQFDNSVDPSFTELNSHERLRP